VFLFKITWDFGIVKECEWLRRMCPHQIFSLALITEPKIDVNFLSDVSPLFCSPLEKGDCPLFLVNESEG
jgi:hypothetical protein